jgi:hypothetical protein
MISNSAGLAATAIADEARENDLLRISPENSTAPAETQAPVYVASDIKRFRRTKDAITSIKNAISDILEKDNPQTVRQVFYALTVRGFIKKEEIEYQRDGAA